MREFIGPNFGLNGYAAAKYRVSDSSMVLEGDRMYRGLRKVTVPSRLEVLDSEGNWQQHPVVFIQGGFMTIFLHGGRYHQFFGCDRSLLDMAEACNLTRGTGFWFSPAMFPRDND